MFENYVLAKKAKLPRWAIALLVTAVAAHAVAGALKLGVEMGSGAVIVVNLSGRGDKDVETAAKWFGLFDGAQS